MSSSRLAPHRLPLLPEAPLGAIGRMRRFSTRLPWVRTAFEFIADHLTPVLGLAWNFTAFILILIFDTVSRVFGFAWTLSASISSFTVGLFSRQAPQETIIAEDERTAPRQTVIVDDKRESEVDSVESVADNTPPENQTSDISPEMPEEASFTFSPTDVDVQEVAESTLAGPSPNLQDRDTLMNPPSLAPFVSTLPQFDTVDDNTPDVCPSNAIDTEPAEVFVNLTCKPKKTVRFIGDDDVLREPQHYRMYPRDGPPNVFLDPVDNEDNLRWAQVGAAFRLRDKRWKRERKKKGRVGFLKKYHREWNDEKFPFPGAFDYGKKSSL